ncbi:MAG TPA: hypothetical protein VE912_04170 [Bacteroidales bacterium]|nr:hypothetical protein [Bacteroidales bacterium]
MRKIYITFFLTLILTLSGTSAFSQNLGLGVGFSSEKAALLEFSFKNKLQIYSLGFSYQFTDTRGKLVSEQKSNYGRTKDGTGTFFWTIDAGAGYYLTQKFSLKAEISVGATNDYTNYIDHRFNGDGYHIIDKSKIIAGIGGLAGYDLSQSVTAFAGYNSIRNITFGIQFNFSSTN